MTHDRARSIDTINLLLPRYNGDKEILARDALADLMHWCDAHGIDFNNELRIAYDFYAQETDV